MCLFKEAVKKRTPLVFSPTGQLERETLSIAAVEACLLPLSGGPSDRRVAEQVCALLCRRATLPAAGVSMLPLVEWLVMGGQRPVSEDVELSDFATDIADALDSLARLYCAALNPLFCPGVEEPVEQSIEVCAPSTVSSAALRRTLSGVVGRLSQVVKDAVQKGEASDHLSRSSCSSWYDSAPGTGPVRQRVHFHWPVDESECPLCGNTAQGGGCRECSPASARAARHQTLTRGNWQRGGECWWHAASAGALQSVRFHQHSGPQKFSAAVLEYCAQEVEALVQTHFVQNLRGKGGGVRSSEVLEHRGRPAPCLISTDRSLHDATTSVTGLRPSMVHSGWERRRATKRKATQMCPYSLHEKTLQETRTGTPGMLFSPSCLNPKDERTCVEAMQSAVKRARLESPSCIVADCARVLVEGCSLAARGRALKRTRDKMLSTPPASAPKHIRDPPPPCTPPTHACAEDHRGGVGRRSCRIRCMKRPPSRGEAST